LALTDDPDVVQKLTVTSKAELSIDPRLAEIEPYDTLSLKYLCEKESYLGQLSWTPAQTSDTYVGTMQVNPMCEVRTTVGSSVRYVPTSLSYASRPMRYWSGTIRIRIQVVASQYHRGRLAIVYSPTLAPATDEIFNTSYNMIVDLAEGRDFAFDINWQQPFPYAPITSNSVFSFLTTGLVNPSNSSNGAIYMRVVNKLVVPDGVTPAILLFSISAGEDFELVDPAGNQLNTYVFEAQSDECLFEAQSSTEVLKKEENQPESSEASQLTGGVTTSVGEKNLVFYGETITSYRQLVKRYTFVRRCSVGVSNGAGANISTVVIPLMAMPPEPGYDTNGWDITLTADNFTYAGVPYLLYIRRAFAGWKGSI
jgi:hypothetical protein